MNEFDVIYVKKSNATIPVIPVYNGKEIMICADLVSHDPWYILKGLIGEVEVQGSLYMGTRDAEHDIFDFKVFVSEVERQIVDEFVSGLIEVEEYERMIDALLDAYSEIEFFMC